MSITGIATFSAENKQTHTREKRRKKTFGTAERHSIEHQHSNKVSNGHYWPHIKCKLGCTREQHYTGITTPAARSRKAFDTLKRMNDIT